MPYIKFKREDDNKRYNGLDALETLIEYVFRFDKTAYDSVHHIYGGSEYSGCSPFPFPLDEIHNPVAVYQLMALNNNAYTDCTDDIIQHRIVSFHASDLVLAKDLDELGRIITGFYCSEGFIAAYGVHKDKAEYHIHTIVASVSYRNGSKINIYNEIPRFRYLVNNWYNEHLARLDSDPKRLSEYQNLLFGDSFCKYGQSSLSVRGQIAQNRKNQ